MLFQRISIAIVLAFLSFTLYVNTLPVPTAIQQRQSISVPGGINITDIGDFSPIEDGFLEGDSDDGSGNDNGSSSVAIANGLGTVGSGQSAENPNGVEGSSSACSLTSCSSGASSANGNSTSSSTSSSSVGVTNNSPIISTNGPLIDLGTRAVRAIRRWLSL